MEAVKNGMQHNLLLERGIQFAPCSPFTVLECILLTTGEMNRFPCRFAQQLLVQSHSMQSSRGTSFLSFLFIIAVRISIWSLEMPSLFVECDSGGYSILTDSHLGIMMLV